MGSVEKRLADIERLLRSHEARYPVILIAAQPEDQEAHDARLRGIRDQIQIFDNDLIVEIVCHNNQAELPRLYGT